MHIILPTGSLSDNFYNETSLFCNRRSLETPLLKECANVIIKLTEEIIFNKLHWTSKIDSVDDVLKKHISWYVEHSLESTDTTDESVRISNEYYSDIVDSYIIQINEILTPIINQGKDDDLWRIWHTFRAGNDLMLEKGTDYRIMEYERKVLNGEIDTNPNIAKIIKGKQ